MCLPFRKKKRSQEPTRERTPAARPLIASQPPKRRVAVPASKRKEDNSLLNEYTYTDYPTSRDYGGTYGAGYVQDDSHGHGHSGHSSHGHSHGHGYDSGHGHGGHGYDSGHGHGGHDHSHGGWGGGHDSGGGGYGGDGGGGGGDGGGGGGGE